MVAYYFCFVAQPAVLFLPLKLLSGKVRLTFPRTTGSEWKRDKQRKVERQITRDGSGQFRKTTAYYEGQGASMKRAANNEGLWGTKETLIITVKPPVILSGPLISHCV